MVRAIVSPPSLGACHLLRMSHWQEKLLLLLNDCFLGGQGRGRPQEAVERAGGEDSGYPGSGFRCHLGQVAVLLWEGKPPHRGWAAELGAVEKQEET